MQKIWASLLMLSSVMALDAAAGTRVIYGEDNRMDVYEEKDLRMVELAKSTAAMVPKSNLKKLNELETELGGTTLQDRGICPDERFASQPTVANCSGFLVAENKIVTAGHCVQNMSSCQGNVWVFDYRVDYEQQDKVIVENSKIYGCKKIISQVLDHDSQNDYALIELEEIVDDREPLKVRTEGAPQVGDGLVVIGHPTGLPTKIAAGAAVRSLNDIFLISNLDTYGGNSGSPVFNAATGLVEGILVRGEKDYVWDSEKGCRASNVFADDEGNGEDVTLISNVKELMPNDSDNSSDVDEQCFLGQGSDVSVAAGLEL